MNYNEFYNHYKTFFLEHNIPLSTLEYILKYHMNITEKQKIENHIIEKEIIHRMKKDIKRILNGEPLQYIVGTVDFCGIPFITDKRALIPRFETEELVMKTIDLMQKYLSKNIHILDIGTGSGVIGLTIKKMLPSSKVDLLDISTKALNLARRNANKLKLEAKFIKSNMLEQPIKMNKKYDVIISNPPYIREDEPVMEMVLKYEPEIALFGGKDGLIYYETILKNASKVLNPKNIIAFEIGEEQGEDIIAIAKTHFPDSKIELHKDMQDRNRMLFILNKIE